jgi:hypothetical protein
MRRFLRSAIFVTLLSIPFTAMAQQGDSLVPAGKSPVQSESPAVGAAKPAGDPATPKIIVQSYDPIGNEEEMDAEDGFDYQEWLQMWPEQDEGREYDPMDPREDAQEADTRE